MIETATTNREPSMGDRISMLQLANSMWGNQGSIAKAFLMHKEESLCADIKTLQQLRDKVMEEGLDCERDREVLVDLFGGSREESQSADPQGETEPDGEGGGDSRETEEDQKMPENSWVQEYRLLAEEAASGDRRVKRQAVQQMIEKLDKQIDFLEREYEEARDRQEDSRRLACRSALVPGDKVVDRLLRYEGSLERVFDRTLSQLERLQRLRLGQNVPPPIKVELAS